MHPVGETLLLEFSNKSVIISVKVLENCLNGAYSSICCEISAKDLLFEKSLNLEKIFLLQIVNLLVSYVLAVLDWSTLVPPEEILPGTHLQQYRNNAC